MERLEPFLKNEFHQFVEVLPSRWSALLRTMSQYTQQYQKSLATPAELQLLEDKFTLCEALLADEHTIIRKGGQLFEECSCEKLRTLLRQMTTATACKESMIADWKSTASSITGDVLRVYCHSIMVVNATARAQGEELLTMVHT
ncbi:hypothetical protein AGDE_04908 [Angomonas deanei]|uniref:Uncharacterized protein n=1 Tax=Angomonas deanei TaxID=59799 RepID=A0A7G2C2T5_9TRYP|nr:hypothetical protein AGDE_04908 [Angomonas deanei]CAD2214050.1 hypothetical protein, conserved [Angomonas deanei]|eukprot:EPY39021.1 hypothetical protein AGDE_04908 [Angomonas deanei]